MRFLLFPQVTPRSQSRCLSGASQGLFYLTLALQCVAMLRYIRNTPATLSNVSYRLLLFPQFAQNSPPRCVSCSPPLPLHNVALNLELVPA